MFGAGGIQVLRVLTFLSLAPIIGPEPYGLIALAAILVAPFDLMLISAGWFEALLRTPNVTYNQQASLFWTHLAIGIIAIPLILMGAPALAYWFDAPELTTVLVLLASVPAAQGAAIVPRAILARGLRFKALATVELVSVILGFLAALALALSGGGVLSLVAMQIVTSWTAIALYLVAARFLPAFRLRLSEIRGFAHVTSRLFGVALLKLIEQLSVRALIGSTFGTVALGNYVFARRILEMILKGALGAVGRVGLAHIGRSGQTRSELLKITANVVIQGVVLTWPLFILLMVGGSTIVAPLVNDDWSAAIPLVAWIGVVGMALPISRAFQQLLLGCGRPTWILIIESAGLVVLLVFVVLAVAFDQGLVGIVQATAARNILIMTVFAACSWIALSRFVDSPALSVTPAQQSGNQTGGQENAQKPGTLVD